MNNSYQSEHSNLLVLSQAEQPSKSSSRYQQFIAKLNQVYGIPILQLDDIYSSNYQLNKKGKESGVGVGMERGVDQYADKLAVNHNILKEMLHMIDNKVVFRHCEDLKGKVNIQEGQMGVKQCKQMKEYEDNVRCSVFKKQEQGEGRLERKMLQVKLKLKEVIAIIDQQVDQKINIMPNLKKIINMDDIKQSSSNYDFSLQYSKELQQSKDKYHIKEALQNKNILIIDRQKLDKAKEVTSEYLLHNNMEEEKNEKQDKNNYDHLGCSLDRISEVMSGQTLQKIQDKYMSKQSGYSFKDKMPDDGVKLSIHLVERQNEVGKQDKEDKELDETGRIILSTINKKISSTTIPFKERNSQLTEKEGKTEDNQNVGQTVKLNKFWKNNKSNLDAFSKNTLMSHESIQQSKTQFTSHRNSLQTDKNYSNSKFEFKNIKRYPTLGINNLSYQQSNDQQQILKNSINSVQRSQINFIHNYDQSPKGSQPTISQFIRHPLPYSLPDRTNVMPNKIININRPLITLNDQRRNSSAPNYRESRVLQQFSNLNKISNTTNPTKQPQQNIIHHQQFPQILSTSNPEYETIVNNSGFMNTISRQSQSLSRSNIIAPPSIIRQVRPINTSRQQRQPIIINRPQSILQQQRSSIQQPISYRQYSLPSKTVQNLVINSQQKARTFVQPKTNRSQQNNVVVIKQPPRVNHNNEQPIVMSQLSKRVMSQQQVRSVHQQPVRLVNQPQMINNSFPNVYQQLPQYNKPDQKPKPNQLSKIPNIEKRFNIQRPPINNNNIQNTMNISQKNTILQSQINNITLSQSLQRQNRLSLQNFNFPKPLPINTIKNQNPFKSLQHQSSLSSFKNSFEGSSKQKPQLQQIIQISEGSAQNSIIREIGDGRSNAPSQMSYQYQNIDTSRGGGTTSRKLKKKGITITNHAYRSQYTHTEQ